MSHEDLAKRAAPPSTKRVTKPEVGEHPREAWSEEHCDICGKWQAYQRYVRVECRTIRDGRLYHTGNHIRWCCDKADCIEAARVQLALIGDGTSS